MPKYITHGLVHKKGLGKQRVGKQTSGQNIKGENRFENGAHWLLSPVGCVKALWRYATRRASKQKRRLLRFPCYYQYSNEIAVDLLSGAGLL